MESNIDALVVGAGFSGIYQLYKLRELGLSVTLIDAGSEIGGTWHWNRYPGATSDTLSEVYRYSWDKEDLLSYPWKNRYLSQPEIQAYLRHIVDHHHLNDHIKLNTTLVSARFEQNTWAVQLGAGETVRARYLVMAVGNLSKTNLPNIPGIKDFAGDIYHSANWPEHHDFRDKRIGVIGNGSTGVQIMTAIADEVKQLVLFQRHPQYVVPNGQRPVSKEYQSSILGNYDDVWKQVKESVFGHGIRESTISLMSVDEAEREQALEEAWKDGNALKFLFGVFGDIGLDKTANEYAADFIRRKISTIVKDPVKARKLTPTGLWTRRPVNGPNYFEIFNKDHVDVVDIQTTPIEILPHGIKASDGTYHELDVIVLATGFEAFEGSYDRLDIAGRDGEKLREHWKAGPTSYLAVAVPGFPNMFMLNGPQGPYGNVPPIIEPQVEFISSIISSAITEKKRLLQGLGMSSDLAVTIEASLEGEKEWTELCQKLSDESLLSKGTEDSWLVGTNVAGGQPRVLFYLGGLGSYRKRLQEEVENGYEGFKLLLK